ncbi:MAG: MucR family transcriptional regulator, partial [Erythrobacter sp.]
MQDLEIDMKETLITLTSDIVAAHVGNNDVAINDVPALITSVYNALSNLGEAPVVEE